MSDQEIPLFLVLWSIHPHLGRITFKITSFIPGTTIAWSLSTTLGLFSNIFILDILNYIKFTILSVSEHITIPMKCTFTFPFPYLLPKYFFLVLQGWTQSSFVPRSLPLLSLPSHLFFPPSTQNGSCVNGYYIIYYTICHFWFITNILSSSLHFETSYLNYLCLAQ